MPIASSLTWWIARADGRKQIDAEVGVMPEHEVPELVGEHEALGAALERLSVQPPGLP